MAKNNTFDKSSLSKEELTFFENRKLKDKFFIGKFTETESGYQISDIRRSDFSKIKYKPAGAKVFVIETEGFFDEITEDEAYYRFTWVMVKSKPEYVFDIDEDEDIVKVAPEDIINLLYADIYDYPPSASEKIVNTLDTLKNQLTASGKEVFIYELLQNANDYPQKVNGKKQPVDVEFHITDNYLVFQHSGDYFDAKNIAAICSINDKEKTDNAEAIGYKGIGFKTVFLDNNYVLLRTGDYQFRFDYDKTKDIDDTPWQILPIWTEDDEVDEEVLDVMDNADDKFRVQIALCPTEQEILRESDQNYEELFSGVFETERVILFIPYINSVSVYMEGDEEPTFVRVKENDKWCVSEPKKYVGDISPEMTKELNRRIDKNDGKIPEKYYNFQKTSVGFACKREGNKLIPVDNTCLYCYLPAKKAKFGFGFLMNTDMIPTGPRDNVEPKEKINHEIAKIAGQQFFHWIHDLLESEEYDYDSVFSLIPDFDELEDKFEDDEDVLNFIKEFQEGFEEELQENELIPVEDEEGNTILVKIEEVNYDETGLTCTDIIDDDKLREITEWSDYFPHPELRDKDKKCYKPGFERFFSTYVSDGFTFDEDELINNCENEAFQEWLNDIDNNNAFLDFLLTKEYIVDFKDKAIFKTEDDELKESETIYENIDDYYPDLVAFNDYLPRLCKATREYFDDDENWSEAKKDLFREFNADNFVDSELRDDKNLNNTIERLKDKETSLGFYNFLAKNVGYTSGYKVFPVISFNDEVIENFDRKIYFYHEDGEELYDADWTDGDWINLISDEYSEDAKTYFRTEFKIGDFSIKDFINDILLTDEAREYLNELGEEHISFVQYCYEHEDLFNARDLVNYALWTYDKEGENQHVLSEEVIFFQDNDMDDYQKKSWIKNGWMYKLDNDYYEGIDDKDSFEVFLKNTFGALDFTMESFYKKVIKEHDTDICDNVGGSETDSDTEESIDVLTFLGENFKLIFEDHANDRFTSLPLYRYDVWDAITDRDVEVYLYDENLKSLLDSDWMPADIVYMLEDKYNDIFAKYPQLRKKLEISKYTFKGFKENLLNDIDSLKNSIENKDYNIAFHRFMLDNKDDLTKSDYKAISQISIYATDNDDNEEAHSVEEPLYISNNYMEAGKGVEAMVKKYDETAYFTSDAYLSEDADEMEIAAWKDYFVCLGVSFNIHDIVFNSILPNLEDIKEKDIPILLSNYYDDFHAEDVWDTVIDDLKKINVLVKSGEEDFLPLKDALFNDCYKSEPYPYLVIEDETSDIYKKHPEVMRLLREIVEEGQSVKDTDFRSFKSVEDWKKEKLEWYLYLQGEDINELESVHVRFVQDLAQDYTQFPDLYPKVKVKDIMLKGKDDEYYTAKDLIEGTAYQPRCYFERYNIKFSDNKTYLSEIYLPFENPDPKVFRKLFTDMDVVYDIHKEHFALMEDNYEFTVYFWSEYLTQYANRTHINAIGTKELENYACIPTSNTEAKEVKKPNQMYSQSLIQDGYVKGVIRCYEDKMPLEAIFSTKEVSDILTDLSFAYSLSFNDCLDALLHIKNKEKRQYILNWLASKNHIDEEAVEEYLESEKCEWRNGRGEFVRLNDLYVLGINEDRLRQLFGKSPNVLAGNYMESKYVFDAFCKIFKIEALTEDDFELTPAIIDEPTTEEMRNKLRLPLLIVAAVSDPDNWNVLFDGYCQTLDKLSFHRCKSISFNYEEILKDSSIQYHKKDNDLYFVKDWMGRRVFKDMIADFIDTFDIDMDNNILEGIFEADEENQEEIIDHYVDYNLTSDSEFLHALAELNEKIAKGVEVTREEEEDAGDNSSDYGTKTRKERNEVDDFEPNSTDEEEENDTTYEDYEEVYEKNSNNHQNSDSNTYIPEEPYSELPEEPNIPEEDFEELPDDAHVPAEEISDLPDEANIPKDELTDIDDETVLKEQYSEPDEYPVEDYDDDDKSYEDDDNYIDDDETEYEHTQSYSGTQSTGSSSASRSGRSSKSFNKPYNDDVEDDDNDFTKNAGKNNRQSSGSKKRDFTGQTNEEYAPRRSPGQKRRNYMGYDPDETNHRPFNVGKQEATTLETKEATEEEISRLSSLLGRAFDKDSIVDENYLVRMRFYNSVKQQIGNPKMSEKEFITKGRKYMETSNGKWVHRCSARGGILYVSPSIWNRVKHDNCVICMYYGKKANQFLYIRSQKELMDMIDKDAVVVQVTGNDKGAFINTVYDKKFPGMDGNIYTMIRTIKTSGDDFIFDPNESQTRNDNDFDPDLV